MEDGRCKSWSCLRSKEADTSPLPLTHSPSLSGLSALAPAHSLPESALLLPSFHLSGSFSLHTCSPVLSSPANSSLSADGMRTTKRPPSVLCTQVKGSWMLLLSPSLERSSPPSSRSVSSSSSSVKASSVNDPSSSSSMASRSKSSNGNVPN